MSTAWRWSAAGRPSRPSWVSATNTAAGARGKADGGCVLEVSTSKPVCEGLAMPHSPRWHDGALWVLDSGRGALCRVDLAARRAETVAELPGFTRGLDFLGPYALVGLSHARERAWFGDLPITREDYKRQCGVWIVDTRNGQEAGRLQFDDAVQEVFEVRVLHGQRFPELLNEDQERINGSFALPDEALTQVDTAYREKR
ncbi:MAG: TIGR03032 family protein [Planctomycetota bacterium]|nr:TIGR03032 family protein [Planctomycetota bacterium]